jgi:hypothetical protein
MNDEIKTLRWSFEILNITDHKTKPWLITKLRIPGIKGLGISG